MVFEKLPTAVEMVVTDDDTWWKHGQRSTMQQFLSQYTLHDSYWNGIRFQQTGSCQAIMKLDSVHIDPELITLDLPISMNRKHYNDDPYLCLNFPNVHQILSDHSQKYVTDYVVNYASTKMITTEQRTSWLDLFLKSNVVGEDAGDFLLDENLHCTTFEGTGRNHVYLIHSEPIIVLAVKSDGSILHLPHLEISK